MDNDKQNIGAAFNLNAYGLVQRLLSAGIPVKWAIKAGKTKTNAPTDQFDFKVFASRVAPSAIGSAELEFYGGPFIVTQQLALATTTINNYNAAVANDVAVYSLTGTEMIDIRYTLTQKPYVKVLDDGGQAQIHVATLLAAGFGQATCVGGPGTKSTRASDCNGGGAARGRTARLFPSLPPSPPPVRDADHRAALGRDQSVVMSPVWPSAPTPRRVEILAQRRVAHTNRTTFDTSSRPTVSGTERNTLSVYPNADLLFSQFVPTSRTRAARSTTTVGISSAFQNSGIPIVSFTSNGNTGSCVGGPTPNKPCNNNGNCGTGAHGPAVATWRRQPNSRTDRP